LNVLGDTLGGHDRSRLEEYLEAVDLKAIDLKVVNLEAVKLVAVNLVAVDREACAMDADTLFIGILVLWECRELSTTRSTERLAGLQSILG